MRNGILFVVAWLLALPAQAGSITKTYTFSDGATASAGQVNTNFDQLFTELNSKESRITTLEALTPGSPWSVAAGIGIYYNSGNVGIGTATPASLLTVGGRIEANGGFLLNQGSDSLDNLFYVKSAAAGSVDASMGFFVAGLGSTAASQGPYFLGRGNDFSAASDQRGNLYFSAGNPSSPDIKEGTINFWTGSDQPRLIILNDGKVGIGTTTPTSSLDIESAGETALQLVSSGDMTSITANAMNSTNWMGNYYTAQRSRAGFTATQAGDTMFQINAMGNDGNGAFQSASQIQMEVQGPVSAGIVPGKITFNTADTTGTLDSRMTILADGKVGIGTPNPTQTLYIQQKTNSGVLIAGTTGVNSGNASFSLYDSDGNSQWSLASSPAGKFVFWDDLNGKGPFTIESNASDNALYVQSTGNVGIGTASPGYPLDVVGGVNASGGYTSVSDGRLKTDMQPLADSLSKVLKLQGITFHWIDRAKYGDDRQIGLIAQELEKVFPELVKTNAQGFKSVNYSGLVMPTIEAVKSLHGRLEEQGRELNQVKAENTALKAQVRALGDYLCAQNPAAGFCAK